MKKPAVSFSRLNAYELCPKKFYHNNVAKDVSPVFGSAADYGKEVHKALELRVKKGKKLPMHMTHLEKYAAKFANPKPKPDEILTEQQLAITEDMGPTGWFDRDVWFRSIVDYLAIKGSDAVLVDYKTGRMSDDFTQLQVSACILFLFRPELERIKLMYWWIKDKKITSEVITREDTVEVWNMLMPRIESYNKAHRTDTFPKRQNFLCKRNCEVKDCPLNGI